MQQHNLSAEERGRYDEYMEAWYAVSRQRYQPELTYQQAIAEEMAAEAVQAVTDGVNLQVGDEGLVGNT